MKRYYIGERLINLIDCSISYMEYGCDQVLHSHEAIEMVYTIAGQGEHIVNGQAVKTKRGSLIIMDSNCTYEIKMWETMKYYNIMFRGSFLNMNLDKESTLGQVLDKAYGYNLSDDFLKVDFKDEETAQKVSEIFFEILDESVRKENRYENVVRSDLDIIINMILRRADSQVAEVDDMFFSEVMEYVQNQSNNALSLVDAAKRFNYDPDHFSRKLKNCCGMTFKQLVISKKLSDVIYNLMLVSYNSNGVMQKIVAKDNVDVVNGSASVELIPEETFANGTVIKAHIWDSLSDMRPITNITGNSTELTITTAE